LALFSMLRKCVKYSVGGAVSVVRVVRKM